MHLITSCEFGHMTDDQYIVYINHATKEEIFCNLCLIPPAKAALIIQERERLGKLTWHSLLDIKGIRKTVVEMYWLTGCLSFGNPSCDQILPARAVDLLVKHYILQEEDALKQLLDNVATHKSPAELNAAVSSSFGGIEDTLVKAIVENNCTVKRATTFLELDFLFQLMLL